MRSRIYRWYRQLEAVDDAAEAELTTEARDALLEELARIERDLRAVEVPLSFTAQLYDLRLHIDLLRQKLRAGA
jgi:hypothetical protein